MDASVLLVLFCSFRLLLVFSSRPPCVLLVSSPVHCETLPFPGIMSAVEDRTAEKRRLDDENEVSAKEPRLEKNGKEEVSCRFDDPRGGGDGDRRSSRSFPLCSALSHGVICRLRSSERRPP